MHSSHRYCRRLLLLLLLLLLPVFGRAEKFNDEMKDLVTFVVVVNVMVLLIGLLALKNYCFKQKERETSSEKSFEALESREHESCEKGAENVDAEGDKEENKAAATAEEKQGRITFAKGREGDFDLNDLFRASAEALGKGGFGSCYKTKLENGGIIVVKRLKDLAPVSMEDFMEYMRLLSAMEHPNLLPLLGYYYSDEKLLISNYASNGNLFHRIHGKGAKGANRTPFTWSSRLQVAHGVARALEFLHTTMKGMSILPHGNLKTVNILLSENDKPLVCDYGLLPLIPPSLAVKRMVCYRSPEYQYIGKISKMTDVWSYGCLLLEIMTGKLSMNSTPGGIHGLQLCHWVNRAVREEWTAEVFDAEILVQKRESGDMIMMLKLALWCCEWLPEKRPDMGEVVREIERIMAGAADAY